MVSRVDQRDIFLGGVSAAVVICRSGAGMTIPGGGNAGDYDVNPYSLDEHMTIQPW